MKTATTAQSIAWISASRVPAYVLGLRSEIDYTAETTDWLGGKMGPEAII